MNSFSLNRFWKTFRWVVATNFRTLTMWTVGGAAGVFLLSMIIIGMHDSYRRGLTNVAQMQSSYLGDLQNVSSLCCVILWIAALIGLSTIFLNLNKKAKRESFLMLPASNMEKFLSAVIYVTVVWTLSMFLAHCLGDTLRMVARSVIYGNQWISTIPMTLKSIIPTIHFSSFGLVVPTWTRVMIIDMIVFGFIWAHSLYILSGTLLRKYSFVVSSLVLILSIILTAWIVEKLDLKVFYVETIEIPNTKVDYVQKTGVMGYVLGIGFPLLACFNYWASYRIFKGFQLITNKWTNYDILKR